jgi:hypothetical protein
MQFAFNSSVNHVTLLLTLSFIRKDLKQGYLIILFNSLALRKASKAITKSCLVKMCFLGGGITWSMGVGSIYGKGGANILGAPLPGDHLGT